MISFSLGKILFTTVRIFWTRPHEKEIETLTGMEYTPSDTKSYQYWTSHCKTAYLWMCHEASEKPIATIASIDNTENMGRCTLNMMTTNFKIMLICQENSYQIFFSLIFVLFESLLLSLTYPTEVARKNKLKYSCCYESQSQASLMQKVQSRSWIFLVLQPRLFIVTRVTYAAPCAWQVAIGCWSWWTLRG